MKLRMPDRLTSDQYVQETRYLNHCANIARIIANNDSVRSAEWGIELYLKLVDAEVEEI